MISPENRGNAQSGNNLFKLHEVSILDLDKEGSLLNDADSDAGNGKLKVTLDGDLGEGTDSRPLIHQPSVDLDRGSGLEERPAEEDIGETLAKDAENFELDDDDDEDE